VSLSLSESLSSSLRDGNDRSPEQVATTVPELCKIADVTGSANHVYVSSIL
jgi:hypothetical protein